MYVCTYVYICHNILTLEISIPISFLCCHRGKVYSYRMALVYCEKIFGEASLLKDLETWVNSESTKPPAHRKNMSGIETVHIGWFLAHPVMLD